MPSILAPDISRGLIWTLLTPSKEHQMRFKTKIAIVVFSTVIAFYAIVGSFMSKSGQVVARGSQYGQLQIFDEVLSHIIRDYVDQPDLEKVRIGSVHGRTPGPAPYTQYLSS